MPARKWEEVERSLSKAGYLTSSLMLAATAQLATVREAKYSGQAASQAPLSPPGAACTDRYQHVTRY